MSKVLGKCSLEALNLSNNEIGDDGITVIAGALGNSQISILVICKCGITLNGAKITCKRLEDKHLHKDVKNV